MNVYHVNKSEFVLAPSMDEAIIAWRVTRNRNISNKLTSIEMICEINVDWYAITTKQLNDSKV